VALLVSDANIFIDLEDGGLVEAIFRLPETVAVPDLLFEDELRHQHAHLIDHGLVLVELSSDSLARVVQLAGKYFRPSRLDLAALAAAEQQKCPLLTGDRNLRSAALAEGVEVHGTLWLADRFVSSGIVSLAQLREAYARMRVAGRRLPWAEVDEQLRRLSSSR
jgi:predicted nucleic acid-binding protein